MKAYFSIAAVAVLVYDLTACAVPVCCGPEKDVFDKDRVVDSYVGLWNSSTTNTQGEDIIYTRISRNGDIIEYDFDGDDIDKGLDCYTVETGSLLHRGASNFVIRADMHENLEFAISLSLIDNGQTLEVFHLEPVNGKAASTFEPYSEIWHRVLDDSFLNNEPSCQKAK